jgi:hypothetical protein
MKRYHQELCRTMRAHWLHLRWAHGWPSKSVDCVCDVQAGRFRKSKALGCRQSGCLLCHGEKILGIPSVKDRIRRDRYLDSLGDDDSKLKQSQSLTAL